MDDIKQYLTEGRAIDLFVVYRFLRILTTPWEEQEAFKHGIIDKDGNEKPLFFRHILPPNTIDVNVEISENGNRHDVDTGFKIEETPQGLQIYTNYQNYYNRKEVK